MSDTTIKLLASSGAIVSLFVIRWLVLRAVHRYVEDTDVWFRARRVVTYSTTAIAIVSLAWIWLDAFDSLPTYLGLVSAGVAIALSDVLKSIAGWFYIMSRRPFRMGNRIEVLGTQGDVVDIRLFRFSLMEIGNWVHADQSTGRLVHIPNGVVFDTKIANYTEGFEHIWHEIPVLITFESNWRSAKAIVWEIIDEVAIDVDERARELMRETARAYHIKIGTLTPIVYLTVQDSGVLITGRFLIEAKDRRGSDELVWEKILDRFHATPGVDLAYPTVRTYFDGPIRTQTNQVDTANPA